MGDHSDLGFKAEYAKSSRASCKACKGGITQDSLRLAIMVQSPMFDGKIPNWFHFKCFWKRARCGGTHEIYGYDGLRWEDQQKIKEQLGGEGGAAGDAGTSGIPVSDFTTEYAKSGAAKCRGCEDKIAKVCVGLIKGFQGLKKEDKDTLIEKLGKGEKSAAGKKRKGEEAQGSGGKKKKQEETAEEKALKG
ncbi:PARP1-like protein [Mya arenaria]|uniref:PARP1-like protein n=1 Tax=Mya arenaria TaxID=6604 RepID=A0ABY7FBV2_MYAAR|nr:PARP1-like protein [Mya arenaria]